MNKTVRAEALDGWRRHYPSLKAGVLGRYNKVKLLRVRASGLELEGVLKK